MNKTKLQEELLKNVKPGIKPSDLKKQKKNSQTNNQLLTPPPTPPLKPVKTNNSPSPIVQYPTPPDSPLLKPTQPSKPANNVKDLQQQVSYWSKTAQNHLLNLSKTSAELFNAEERIKELESKPKSQTLSQEAEKALVEANQRIRELEEKLSKTTASQEKPVKPVQKPEQTIFTCSDCNQTKSHQELSRQFANHSFCRSCSVKARKAAEKQIQEQPIQFTCHTCQKNHHQVPTKMKLDQTLQEYLICSTCRPNVKEFNEADLITDELWQKYPYSSASEILEKEFDLKRRSE
ncbi:hypothetical protein [endosymbiont GvMRE of Glomus versiforme]|uniref:hypothetical protein n=1 Tax=endosymbiont GvMRE of Glomus versiforme TaxID=2039283 RepID=UPI000ED10A9A|nr:hypothetical protein [endosymbiont GvMRE of Glomus versiforme]RHZ37209.1 hypothetical protein GvMRE_I1g645 [endosymbiont GvMRE of Glomus versiforme]RHZ37448.1 hypothetical protein GvMRE_I1g132 [endosymbiont GvMRE of Glomus versiforme]RHZ37681.1 hypothetical protein GvMRE_I1g14 [endosymbiont GvMRE of Glomus versiforme]